MHGTSGQLATLSVHDLRSPHVLPPDCIKQTPKVNQPKRRSFTSTRFSVIAIEFISSLRNSEITLHYPGMFVIG